MGKHFFLLNKIIFIIMLVFLGLTGCQFQGQMPSSIPSPALLGSWKPTQIPITVTASKIPTESPAKTIVPTETSTPVFLPPPGEYIAYSSGKSIQLVSSTGEEAGTLMEGAGDGRNWLSPNQDIVAYNGLPHIIQFRYIYTGEIITIKEQENCKFGGTDLAWNPKGDQIILTCGYDNSKDDLKLMTFPDAKIIGRIEKIINFKKDADNLPNRQTWSPDGRWIAFFVFSGSQDIEPQGPFLTDASCLSDDTTCPSKTTLKINNPFSHPSWTPDSNLALFDSDNYSVNIYRMPTFSLIQTIKIPDDYWGLDTFAWSHNKEWFAIGGMDGIFIMSSKTGEIRQISKTAASVLFWIEIK